MAGLPEPSRFHFNLRGAPALNPRFPSQAYSCAQEEIWQTVEDSIQQVLEATTLEHLATRQSVLIGAADHQADAQERILHPIPTGRPS